jgi:hypothetical protein
MSDTITFERSKLIEMRDNYLLAVERGKKYRQDAYGMPENNDAERRSKRLTLEMYEHSIGKAQGLAEGIEELFFIVDGKYPLITVKGA